MKLMRTKKKAQSNRTRPCPLCAIDIGSSYIRAAVAVENPDGTLHIEGIETLEPRPNSVERGLIINSSEMSNSIKRILLLLANRVGLHEPIDRVFIAVGGKLLQFVTTTTKRYVNNAVTDIILETMKGDCKTKIENKYTSMAVLSVDPRVYSLDGQVQVEKPSKTQRPRYLEVVYDVFVGRIENKEKVKGAFDRANVSIEQHWVRPDALLTALSDERDRTKGCAIIDFGASTTMMSIYKGDEFLYTSVKPFGGQDINDRIEALDINHHYVEEIKQEYGYASPEYVEKNATLSVRKESNPKELNKVKMNDIAQAIEQQLYETLTPLMADLQELENEVGIVYITGGGCKLKGLLEYVQSMTPIKVEYGTHALWLEMDAPEEYYEPENAMLIGTLALGADLRRNFPDKEPVSTPPWPWKTKIVETTMTLFTGEETE